MCMWHVGEDTQVIKTTAEESDRNWNYTNRAFCQAPKKKNYNRITTYVYITENELIE